MKDKLLFVFNPFSGKGKIKSKLLEIIDIFVKSGREVSVHTTQGVNDAFETVKNRGKDFDLVVASGGDGTLNEVIHGVMAIPAAERPKVGYIPAGTVNDFASNMELPKNMVKAAERVVSGEHFKCDIGDFNGKSFVYVAAFGIFTNVSYETPQQNKNILGHFAYILEGVKQLSSIKSYRLKVECNGEEIEDEFMLGMVANSNHIAGMKAKMLKAQLNDGLFEVVLLKRPKSIFELNDMISHLAMQNLEGDFFKVYKTDCIRFVADEPLQWTLDGEFGGATKEADIRVEKEAVALII